MYVKNPPVHDDKFQKKFRLRFRMPHEEFVKLVDKCKASPMFRRWMSKDAVGRPSSPIELLVLGSLRYLGRGLTFDDIEEYTSINEETIRQFFHVFIEFWATTLYDEYVYYPKTEEEVLNHTGEFDAAGMHGAIASTDATNVIMWNCFHNLAQHNKGFKQNHPARSYNLSCNHRWRILHTTKGHPGRWNDKTLVLFDEFVRGIH